MIHAGNQIGTKNGSRRLPNTHVQPPNSPCREKNGRYAQEHSNWFSERRAEWIIVCYLEIRSIVSKFYIIKRGREMKAYNYIRVS